MSRELEDAISYIDKANGGRLPQYKMAYLEMAKRLIKQALIDKDKLQSKLDKIKEEVNIFNKLDVEYEMNDIDNILKFINILLGLLKEVK